MSATITTYYKKLDKILTSRKEELECELQELESRIKELFHAIGIEFHDKHLPRLNKIIYDYDATNSETLQAASRELSNFLDDASIAIILNNIIRLKLKGFVYVKNWYELKTKLYKISHVDHMSKDEFKVILKTLYDEYAEEMFNAKEWKLGSGLGSLKVRRLKLRIRRSKKTGEILVKADMRASTRKRQELIAQGITVRSKENPDGVDWLVPLKEDYTTGFFWSLRKRKLSNSWIYKFKPITGKYGLVSRLFDFRDKNPGIDMEYELKS